MIVKGHPGQGDWADSPWIGILDPLVTTRPTRGYYACYLVRRDATAACLSLQLGTEESRKVLGDVATRSVLHELTRQRGD